MLSEQPRSSLQVATLAIHKSEAGDADDGRSNQIGMNVYSPSQSQMTPPTTPNGSQEDLSLRPDAPPVFHNFLRAFYPFHQSYAQTDSTVTLPLAEGDIILVHSIHTNGWADGTLLVSGARGWLPTNYCEAYDPGEMGNLLQALLNFWDLLRSTATIDSEIFGNQEFMKGIIAGVRYLLERTHCLTRESALIQRHDGLRRARKSLLSELSSLVKTAKRLQEAQKAMVTSDEITEIVDEMILKAFKIVVKGVRFLDILEDDRRMRAPVLTLMATVLEEKSVPPTPPADTIAFEDNGHTQTAAEPAASREYQASGWVTETSDATQTTNANALSTAQKRVSSHYQSAVTNLRRLSHGSPVRFQNARLSSSVSHRVSLAGPLPLSFRQNLVSERLTCCHDTFLSYLGSFIGRLHLQSQSQPQLALAVRHSATSGGQLLFVIDVVCARSAIVADELDYSRAAMYDRIRELVHAARDILTKLGVDSEEVLISQDNDRLLLAATDCVKATGECVAKTKWAIQKIGDFEFEFDDGTLDVNLGLDLDMLPGPLEERPRAASDVASVSGSYVSDTATHTTALSTVSVSTTSNEYPHHRTTSSLDKPLPEVPTSASLELDEDATPTAKPTTSMSMSSTTSTDAYDAQPQSQPRPLTPVVAPAPTSLTPIAEPLQQAALVRPSLPPLPQLTTTLLPHDDYSPLETSAGHESDSQPSLRPESMAASGSDTAASYLSPDSEYSMVSQASTRATTPDNTIIPMAQQSLSDLSATNSSTVTEEVDDVECKLLERTYCHELMFNKEGQVTGGSLPALVERLTTHESTPDAMFVSTFYLTFRLFCTPIKLAEALIDRFDYVGESSHMASPVRLRVYNVLKGWLESHWRQESDYEALPLMRSFAEGKLAMVLPSAGRRLLELCDRVSSSDGSLVPRLLSSMGKTNTSISLYVPADTPVAAPILTKAQTSLLANWKMGGSCPSVLDFDPLEVARQITIKQMTIFCAIMPEELLGSQWMKKGGVDSPHVKAMTSFSNDLSNLVADTVLQFSEVKRRAAAIKQWIKIANQCFELHNYDALMAIICSLNSSTITRLRRTWDAVSPKRREMLKSLQAIVEPSQNNKVLRGRLQSHVPPCLPFLGMYLTDLTFVDIGNPATKMNDQGLTVVNYDKHSRTAKIIGELQRFQIPYRLAEVPDLQEWLSCLVTKVRELETPGTNAQVSYYRRSLLLEPRETQALRTPVDAPVPAPAPGAQKNDLFGWIRGGNNNSNTNSNNNSQQNLAVI